MKKTQIRENIHNLVEQGNFSVEEMLYAASCLLREVCAEERTLITTVRPAIEIIEEILK
jgi:hypothetical protein